ncbi:MAG: alpha/beta fold hydrolase [Bacteroidales bacterium]|nr:alpha/beta fold hydrolase [Bacteroidales bacterium]MDD4638192.1 alpha/beta fold hydrolase [Bacteroidales bacterium]
MLTLCSLFAGISISNAQISQNDFNSLKKEISSLNKKIDNMSFQFDILKKKLEDNLLYEDLSEYAYIDKVRLPGPPKRNQDSTGNAFFDEFLDNPLIFWSYVFIPRGVDQSKKYPLIVFPHGGIHGTYSNSYNHVIREFLYQGYIVIAPDYRGSTGYGKSFHRAIDYGGSEVEDVLASRDYMVENYKIVDPDRVCIFGWSHGGLHALMGILKYPDKYNCAYAGVPVSDVTFRLSYYDKSYNNLFSAKYHVGETPSENPEEYARRSPVTYASQLSRPLMITTCQNDDDVSVKEVKRMIDALKTAGKEGNLFTYKIYDSLPGAHLFERLDSKESTTIRYNAYKFIEKYMMPEKPFKNYKEMRKAGYFFE